MPFRIFSHSLYVIKVLPWLPTSNEIQEQNVSKGSRNSVVIVLNSKEHPWFDDELVCFSKEGVIFKSVSPAWLDLFNILKFSGGMSTVFTVLYYSVVFLFLQEAQNGFNHISYAHNAGWTGILQNTLLLRTAANCDFDFVSKDLTVTLKPGDRNACSTWWFLQIYYWKKNFGSQKRHSAKERSQYQWLFLWHGFLLGWMWLSLFKCRVEVFFPCLHVFRNHQHISLNRMCMDHQKMKLDAY